MPSFGDYWKATFPPQPTFTEKNVADQLGRVFIVTGASGGIGAELATLLYRANGTVYIAARNQEKSAKAIEHIKSEVPDSSGALVQLHLDLGDLTSIKATAHDFLSKESRLDVLWCNAGVMTPPQGSKTVQGYELQLGTNVLGHHLLVKYLYPLLKTAAASAPTNSVRVIWVGSTASNLAPNPPLNFDDINYDKKDESAQTKYNRSKAANIIQAAEFQRMVKVDGIVSVGLNPGNLNSDLARNMPWWQLVLVKFLVYPAVYGGYTELFAGLSPELTVDNETKWVQPWGRFVDARKDLMDPAIGRKLWDWADEQVKQYYT